MQAQTNSRKRPPTHPPKGSRAKRQEGNPRPLRAFRPPEALDDYLEKEIEEGNIGFSTLIVHLLEVARDVRVDLGDDWHEVMRIAAVEKMPPGKVLARLAKASLKKK